MYSTQEIEKILKAKLVGYYNIMDAIWREQVDNDESIDKPFYIKISRQCVGGMFAQDDNKFSNSLTNDLELPETDELEIIVKGEFDYVDYGHRVIGTFHIFMTKTYNGEKQHLYALVRGVTDTDDYYTSEPEVLGASCWEIDNLKELIMPSNIIMQTVINGKQATVLQLPTQAVIYDNKMFENLNDLVQHLK